MRSYRCRAYTEIQALCRAYMEVGAVPSSQRRAYTGVQAAPASRRKAYMEAPAAPAFGRVLHQVLLLDMAVAAREICLLC